MEIEHFAFPQRLPIIIPAKEFREEFGLDLFGVIHMASKVQVFESVSSGKVD